MKPVVVNPTISLEQLFEELANVEDDRDRAEIRDQILVKMRRSLQKLKAETRWRNAPWMSACGYKQTWRCRKSMSALPPGGDIPAPTAACWLIPSNSPRTAALVLMARLFRLKTYGNGL